MESQQKILSLSEIARSTVSNSLENEVVTFRMELDKGTPAPSPLYIDALLIILVRKGSGRFGIDLTEYEVKENSLIVLQPKNYIFMSTTSDYCSANVIACSRVVVEDVLPKLTDILPTLLHHRAEPVSHLSREDADRLNEYFLFIENRLRKPSTNFIRQNIRCLLQAALYEMIDIHSRDVDQNKRPRTRQEEIMARFIIAVTENFRRERQVSFYANQLCITSKHLSAVVKKISGRTAGEWIDNYVVMEAKVLLKTTDSTIQEISDKLNFKNQSFFGKFFKHLTGHTPTAYRKLNS
ncbi:MAG: helix-turn-helix domain-containing protein [Muribaculaceae bacterium]|nr:helix-turn-helix domain-containing protein [Muribaculaceae bacterium]